jgi:predicted membrane-bound dolichyl-phosphate-mannose-protein mannosyltransferase
MDSNTVESSRPARRPPAAARAQESGVMPTPAAVTARLRPELFTAPGTPLFFTRRCLTLILAALVVAGFGFRVAGLSAEGLSDDELNKLEAVENYRTEGLSSINGEHPLLMKALLTVSLVAAEKWNSTSLVAASPSLGVPVEAALRLPNAIFGALTSLLIFLLAAELFGTEVALVAAALWAFDPSAIGFSRIVKEDTPLLFFFLLANVFWLRGQRAAESGSGRPAPYYWATAVAYGAMVASKYVPFLIAVSISYYYIFQRIKATRWRLGKPRMLLFLVLIGASFLLFNPTILLPGTWQQMLAFAKGQRVGHDSYEFMGTLYPHKMMDWFNGVPWYFYFVFITIKLPLLTLVSFLVGVPLLFRRRLGDGRFFLFFWAIYAFVPFMLVGSKFTRYFTPTLPIIMITAAIGLQFISRLLARQAAALTGIDGIKLFTRLMVVSAALCFSAWAAAESAPHYRLYSNALGGGERAHAGEYFPHDEFYDASVREAMFELARQAGPGARVASETPNLAAYYARQAKRPDLACVSLSDPASLREMRTGDFVVAARGRRYFSNDALLNGLRRTGPPAFTIALGPVPSIDIYILNEASLALIAPLARLDPQ